MVVNRSRSMTCEPQDASRGLKRRYPRLAPSAHTLKRLFRAKKLRRRRIYFRKLAVKRFEAAPNRSGNRRFAFLQNVCDLLQRRHHRGRSGCQLFIRQG